MARVLRFAAIFAIITIFSGLRGAFAAPISPSLAEALRTANASHKILLVDFYFDTCPACKALDGTMEDSSIKPILDSNFYLYKFDTEDPANQDCTKYYGITAAPTTVAFNGDGSVLTYTIGYQMPKEFGRFLSKAIATYVKPEQIHADLADALKCASQGGKQLLVYFYGDWSQDCDKMDKVLEDPKVKESLDKHYYLFRLDVGHMDEHTGCVLQYKLDRLPTIIAFNADGTSKARFTSQLTAQQFNLFLQYSEVFIPLANGVSPELTEAFKAASQVGKQLLVNFCDNSVEDCVKMNETMADNDVQTAMDKHFKYFKLDISDRKKLRNCLLQYRITEPPTIIAFNADGSVSGRLDGYQDTDSIKSFLSMSEGMVTAPQGIHPDLADALKAAKDAGKILLVQFAGDWLQTSTEMDATLANPDVKSILDQKFYLFRLDVGRFEKHKTCTERYKVTGLPYVIAFNDDGSVRTESKGYMSPTQAKTFLKKAESGSQGFTEYDLDAFSGTPDAIKSAIKKASNEGKSLLVYFCGNTSGESDPVESAIRRADAESVASNFALLRIDFTEHRALATKYGWKKSPAILIFKKGGKPGVVIQGASAPDQLISEMKKIL